MRTREIQSTLRRLRREEYVLNRQYQDLETAKQALAEAACPVTPGDCIVWRPIRDSSFGTTVEMWNPKYVGIVHRVEWNPEHDAKLPYRIFVKPFLAGSRTRVRKTALRLPSSYIIQKIPKP